jgi:hypothetical protein
MNNLKRSIYSAEITHSIPEGFNLVRLYADQEAAWDDAPPFIQHVGTYDGKWQDKDTRNICEMLRAYLL